eukprot:5612016-Amphidinium_carterae.1
MGVTKRRLIMDSRQSEVKECTRQEERVQLPRASDVVRDIMDVAAVGQPVAGEGEALMLLVLVHSWMSQTPFIRCPFAATSTSTS